MDNFKKLRKNANLTQSELANKVGVRAAAISKWEKGITVPSLETLVALADFYGTSIDFILGRRNDGDLHNSMQTLSEKQKELLPLIQMLNDRQCQRTYDYLSGMLDVSAEEQKKWQA